MHSGFRISLIVCGKLPFFMVSSYTQLGVPEAIPFRTYSSRKPYRTWHVQMYLPPLHSQRGWEISTDPVSNIPSTTTKILQFPHLSLPLLFNAEKQSLSRFTGMNLFQWIVIPGYLVSPICRSVYSLSSWTLVADSTQVLSYHLSKLKLLFVFFSRFWFNL